MPPNYQNGKIYKIISSGGCYVGSTTGTLGARLRNHKDDYDREKMGMRRHCTARDIIAHPDYKIELVELFPCLTKKELIDREAWHIRNCECVNINIPGRTPQIYALEHKAEIQEYQGKYYQANKEHLKAQARSYHTRNIDRVKEQKRALVNCDICGLEISKGNLARHKKTQHL